jgi:SagB-type dehydrogenase family enzyme
MMGDGVPVRPNSDPRLRESAGRAQTFAWPVADIVALPIPERVSPDPFFEVLARRRTRRTFLPMNTQSLGTLLWHGARVKESGHRELGFALSKRPAPSAGAIHPVHLLLAGESVSGWNLYDPWKHALHRLCAPVGFEEACGSLRQLADLSGATLLTFVVEPAMSEAKYDNAGSLVWRDAGALQATLGLVAEALGLSWCSLGVTGDAWVERLFPRSGLLGVGCALVGGRARP